MATNLRRIVAHIQALTDGVDIVVFPESALTENTNQAQSVPPAADLQVPCNNDTYADTAIQALSCAALAKSTYVVVNLYTVERCTVTADDRWCPASGRNVYNTNVVFDRSGALVSTYRKFNVYYEAGVSSTPKPDLDTFTTDFGVRFGHMICFDVLFELPGHVLIAEGVRNFIFPSLWFSELPALTAVQVQQGWAQAHAVNLLAAGISRPATGSTGSGIYSGALGALGAVMGSLASGADETDTVIVRDVPMEPVQSTVATSGQQPQQPIVTNLNEPLTQVQLMRERLNVLTWRTVNVSEAAVEHQLCTDAGFCCSFEHHLIERDEADNTAADETATYEYIAAVQNGSRTFGGSSEDLTVLSCSVIACRNHSDLATCATLHGPDRKLRQRYMFETLVIGGEFGSNASMVMPSTLVPALVPLPTSMYEWSETPAEMQGGPNG